MTAPLTGAARSQTIHSEYSHDWGTPPEWLEWVAKTLGSDYFDPCPAQWDGVADGLEVPWGRSTYCNHPGSRGGVVKWWDKAVREMNEGKELIWCAFSAEQPRYMHPSLYELPGWIVMPRARLSFIWLGPDMVKVKGKLTERMPEHGDMPIARIHGNPGKSPGNWTVFWTSVAPAEVPEDCVIMRTGVR